MILFTTGIYVFRSCGCTISEMRTGKVPHRDKLTSQRNEAFIFQMGTRKLSYDPKDIAPDASNELKALLSYILAYDKAKRPTAANALKKANELFKPPNHIWFPPS